MWRSANIEKWLRSSLQCRVGAPFRNHSQPLVVLLGCTTRLRWRDRSHRVLITGLCGRTIHALVEFTGPNTNHLARRYEKSTDLEVAVFGRVGPCFGVHARDRFGHGRYSGRTGCWICSPFHCRRAAYAADGPATLAGRSGIFRLWRSCSAFGAATKLGPSW